MKNPRLFRLPGPLLLALLAALSTALRFMLCALLTHNVSIMPDEALYLNLARSLMREGAAALRTQPVTYDSLLYPLALAPIYALPAGVDLQRAFQLWNCVLASLSVFPAYALGRDLSGSARGGYAVALLTLALPDLALTELAMAESLILPLFLSAVCFGLRLLRLPEKERRGWSAVRRAAPCGVICALLYMAKPGLIALGISLSLALIVLAMRSKGKTWAWPALSFAASLLLSLGVGWCVCARALRVDFTSAGVYAQQTPALTVQNLAYTLQGMLLYALFLPISCLAFPFVLPIGGIGKLDPPDKRFSIALLASVCLTALGTSFVVYLGEMTADPLAGRVHLRYLSYYVPAFFALCLSPRLEGARLNARHAALLSLLLAGLFTLSSGAVISGRYYPVDALLLAPIQADFFSLQTKRLFQWGMGAMLMLFAYRLFAEGWTARLRRRLCTLLAGWLILCNICGYSMLRFNADASWHADAREAARTLEGRAVLLVTQDEGYFWNAATAIDTHLRTPPHAVELDDLIANTQPDGTYAPFVPPAYWRARTGTATDDDPVVVLENAMLSRVALTRAVQASATANGCYALLQLPQGQPWLHSALSGLRGGWVQPGGRFTLFDAAMCAQETVTLYLLASSEASDAVLTLSSGEQAVSIPVSTQAQWVSATFTAGVQPFSVQVECSGGVYLESYRVE